MSPHSGYMAREKKPNGTKGGSRKPFKNARIPMPLASIADDRAKELAQEFTQYVKDAVRMRLEAEGRWPPKPTPGAQ